MPILERRPLENIRTRVSEIRTQGVIPTVRTRVEDIVQRVRERTEAVGGKLTRESTTSGVTGGGKRKIRGL